MLTIVISLCVLYYVPFGDDSMPLILSHTHSVCIFYTIIYVFKTGALATLLQLRLSLFFIVFTTITWNSSLVRPSNQTLSLYLCSVRLWAWLSACLYNSIRQVFISPLSLSSLSWLPPPPPYLCLPPRLVTSRTSGNQAPWSSPISASSKEQTTTDYGHK